MAKAFCWKFYSKTKNYEQNRKINQWALSKWCGV